MVERLKYQDIPHKYFGCDTGLEYKPVSTVYKCVLPFVDWEDKLVKKAKRLGITPEELRAEWDRKKNLGTQAGSSVHLDKENMYLSEFFVELGDELYSPVAYEVDPIIPDTKYQIMDLKPGGMYPELITSLKKDHVRIGGTSDEVFISKDNHVHIRDTKGLALDTDIPSPNGFIKMGDVAVGDEIYDGNGNICLVSGVSEIHYNPCYRITFSCGQTVVCDHEHKWEINYRKKSNSGKVISGVFTTEEIENFMVEGKHTSHTITVTGVVGRNKELPIDPYVLGMWIADGNSHCGRITKPNKEIWREFKRRGYSVGKRLAYRDGDCEDRTVLGIRTHLKKLNLLGNKHIPETYMNSSYDDRLLLLKGIMDGDGCFNKTRRRCVLTTTKEDMAKDYKMLIESLGIRATIIKTTATGFGKTVDCWDVCFSCSKSPFLVRNKEFEDAMVGISMFNNDNRRIKKIERVDTVPTKCISVDSPFKTYLCTKSFIKTHNTDRAIEYEGFRGQTLVGELSDLQDCNYTAYSLKCSMYLFFILKANPHLKPGTITLLHNPLERDEDGVPMFYDGKPKVLGEWEIPVDYQKMEPYVKKLLNHYYKVTKPQ